VATPDFVVVGHVVRDLVLGGWRPGGTATFAAVQAQRLGCSVGVVTRAASEEDLQSALPGVELAGEPSIETTTFQNVYDGERRTQSVLDTAPDLSASDVPREWRSSPIALIGPVCGEVPASLTSVFSSALLAVSAQGWLREVSDDGKVRGTAWAGQPFWHNANVLFVSDEDIAPDDGQVDRWTRDVPIVAMTSNRRGARVFDAGRWRSIAAFPAKEVDPTGAGDVFATAFLVELHATNDVAAATRFASAAAACAIEGEGVSAIATRDRIEERMRAHPNVVLR
jgi:sugar/nucleoside kinase (ribokinase family)